MKPKWDEIDEIHDRVNNYFELAMKRFFKLLFVLVCCVSCFGFSAETVKGSKFVVAESQEIGEVPAGFPVRFCLLTNGKRQYVAYYDQDHRMTVASRMVDSDKWVYKVLDTKVGPYILHEELGRGGMAVVYRATHPKTKEVVALKQMLAQYVSDKDSIGRLKRDI